MSTHHPVADLPRGLDELPPHVELVWHGVNDEINLRQFLASDVPWAELDVNLDPTGHFLILRHDTFDERPLAGGETLRRLDSVLPRLRAADRGVKLDFKVGGVWVERALAVLDACHFPAGQVWLNGEIDVLGTERIRRMAARYPEAILQVPVHFLAGYEERWHEARVPLDLVASLGVNRFSVPWHYRRVRELLAQMRRWGFAFNIYGVRDLPAFLEAVMELPASVTTDFNFPEWGYYGRGSGHDGRYWEYMLREAAAE